MEIDVNVLNTYQYTLQCLKYIAIHITMSELVFINAAVVLGRGDFRLVEIYVNV